MKSLKLVVLSLIVALSVFCGIWSTSCSKDACKGVVCQNYGTCAGGLCKCDSGLGGPTCAIIYRNIYSKIYLGNGTDDSSHQYINNTLTFTAGTDTTNFNNMQLTWTNPGSDSVVFNGIVLSNNLSSGSSFSILATTISTAQDTITYTGSGIVNANVASATITETRSIGPPIIVSLNNLIAQ